MLQIYTWPAKCLTTKSTPVDLEQGLPGHPDLEKFERDMIALMITAKGIGLSANQIGITKRFFCIGHESFDVFSKPVIIWNPQIKLDHVDGITFNTRVSKLKWEMAKKKASKI